MSSLEIKLIGKPVVESDGEPSPLLRMKRGMALLAYLAVTQQSHSREAISDLLWDAPSTKSSLNNLRQLLSRVRKWLPGLHSSRTDIVYQPDGIIDFHALQNGLKNNDVDVQAKALQLYTGDLLEGLALDDAPRFNEWLWLERERLRQQVVDTYEKLCGVYGEQKAWEKGIALAQQWVALDRLNEIALQTLLQLLAASSQYEVALRQYELSRQYLWDELGVEPEPETVALAARLQALQREKGQNLSWDSVVGEQPVWTALDQLAEPHPLPANAYLPYQQNDDFAGRREALLQLARLLLPNVKKKRKQHRAVAITGMGGLGKTQLAVEFSYRYGRFFPGGVYWLNFADGETVPEEVVNMGGERGMALFREADRLEQADKIGRVTKAWQEPIPRLLIFDNCEDEALLAKWLPVSGGSAVLLTSRRAHWARALRVTELPLPFLEVDESIHLLQNLVPDLDDDDAAAIAIELGHLPLALHLAGSFLRRYQRVTAAQYLDQLRAKTILNHPSLQGRGTVFSPTGHELDVGRTFAVNWEQLNANDETDALALRLLTSAAQFAPGEPLPSDLLLATVTAKPDDMFQLLLAEDGLARLVGLGFVKMEGQSLVTLHRLVVAFVQVMAPNVGAAKTAVFTTVIQTIAAQQKRDIDLLNLPLPSSHLRHLVESALAHVTPLGQGSILAWQLTLFLIHHLISVKDFTQAGQFISKGLSLTETIFGNEGLEFGKMRYFQARQLALEGQLEQARDLANEAWHLQQKGTSNILDLAEARAFLGLMHMRLGELPTAKQHIEAALQQQEALPNINPEYLANRFVDLGRCYSYLGNFAQSLHFFEQALSIIDGLYGELHYKTADIISYIGSVLSKLGRFQEAKAQHGRALAIGKELFGTDSVQLIAFLKNAGVLEWRIGDFSAARTYFEQSLKLAQTHYPPAHPFVAHGLNDVGEVLTQLGDYEKAQTYHEQALAIRRQIFGDGHFETMRSLSMLGEVLLRQGNLPQAKQALEEAVAIQEEIETNPQALTDSFLLLGETYLKLGEKTSAKILFSRAVKIREEAFGSDNSETARAVMVLGDWQHANGDAEKATLLYQQSLSVLTETVSSDHPYLQAVQERLTAMEKDTS